MKGVLLCGGEGTRLRPHTEVVNKHLVRVDHLPMAEFPLLRMIEAGIKEILIVSGGSNFAGVCKYFGSGRKWNIRIYHAIQDEAGGIAQALGLARSFVGQNKVLVCLGDGLWSANISRLVELFEVLDQRAMVFFKESKTPERFGVLKFNEWKQPIDIIEKPQEFISDKILVGVYMYGPQVFEVIDRLKPSSRGELEITDVNRHFLHDGSCTVKELEGWWSDCGSIETLLEAEEEVKNDRSICSIRS